jgi:hypothetical protein
MLPLNSTTVVGTNKTTLNSNSPYIHWWGRPLVGIPDTVFPFLGVSHNLQWVAQPYSQPAWKIRPLFRARFLEPRYGETLANFFLFIIIFSRSFDCCCPRLRYLLGCDAIAVFTWKFAVLPSLSLTLTQVFASYGLRIHLPTRRVWTGVIERFHFESAQASPLPVSRGTSPSCCPRHRTCSCRSARATCPSAATPYAECVSLLRHSVSFAVPAFRAPDLPLPRQSKRAFCVCLCLCLCLCKSDCDCDCDCVCVCVCASLLCWLMCMCMCSVRGHLLGVPEPSIAVVKRPGLNASRANLLSSMVRILSWILPLAPRFV